MADGFAPLLAALARPGRPSSDFDLNPGTVLPEGRVISFGQPPISMAQGAQAIAQLVQQWPDVDAAVCVSDLSAFGALSECQRRGWSVPQRIAIAGFGSEIRARIGKFSEGRIESGLFFA